jgi:hypothetical protein
MRFWDLWLEAAILLLGEMEQNFLDCYSQNNASSWTEGLIGTKYSIYINNNYTNLILSFAFMPPMCKFSIIHSSFFFIDTTYFGLTGHLEVPRLLWSRNLLFAVKLFCFSHVVASDYFWLWGLTICFNVGILELHVFFLSVIRDVLY